MDATEIVLRLIGAFYVFAGYVATRAALTSLFIDRAIAAIACQKPSAAETAQSTWMLVAACVVLAGGAALMVLLDVALWLFLASAIGQAVYLFHVAPRYFDVESPPDPAGRRQSVNAFVIYLAATAFVAWAAAGGSLVAWQDASWPLLAAPAAVVAAHVGYVVWMAAGSFRKGASPLLGGPDADEPSGPPRDPAQSRRIKVMADYHAHPLWAMDEDLYGDFPPEALGLSPGLTRDLNAWAEAYTSALNPDDPARSLWSEAEHKAHDAMARPLAVQLKRERPDLTIYVLEPGAGVVEVQADDEI